MCECLLSACLTFALLGAPIWLRAWQTYQTPFALLWLLQQLWVVVVCGCTSLAARVLSVYSTQVSSTACCCCCWVVDLSCCSLQSSRQLCS